MDESREDKCSRRIFGALLWLFIIAALLAWAGNARGQDQTGSRVFKGGTPGGPAELRIFLDEPCTDPAVISKINATFVPLFRRSLLKWQGKEWSSCWIERQGRVFSIDEAGDIFGSRDGVPSSVFVDDSL